MATSALLPPRPLHPLRRAGAAFWSACVPKRCERHRPLVVFLICDEQVPTRTLAAGPEPALGAELHSISQLRSVASRHRRFGVSPSSRPKFASTTSCKRSFSGTPKWMCPNTRPRNGSGLQKSWSRCKTRRTTAWTRNSISDSRRTAAMHWV